MQTEPLTSAEKKELRGIGQRLKPHVHVGKAGLNPTVYTEIERALEKNGLIKLRFEMDRAAMMEACTSIIDKTHCELVGKVGRTAVFFKEMPETS